MKRLVLSLALLAALGQFAVGQEPAKDGQEKSAQEPRHMLGWMWINFALLAGGLGYVIAKNVPALLRSRSAEIQNGIREAAQEKAESDARLKEIEHRLNGISSEIEKLRLELITEMNEEGNRLRAETERMVERVHNQAEQEIQFMIKTGRQDLKKYSALLAVDLAANRVRERMTPETQHRLVDAFLADLRQDGNRGISKQ